MNPKVRQITTIKPSIETKEGKLHWKRNVNQKKCVSDEFLSSGDEFRLRNLIRTTETLNKNVKRVFF